jgi:hypothetical protein
VSTAPTRTGTKAIAWAKAQASDPTRSWHNLCLMFVRSCYAVAAREPNAKKAWETARYRHATTNATTIPAGVPVFWRTGTVNWHIAISIGGGRCYSTDIGGKGKVGLIGIDELSRRWGATLLGWSEDLNGFRVYTKPKTPAKPKVPPFPVGIGPGKAKPSARELQQQLKRAGFMPKSVKEADHYGPATKAAVARFHAKYPAYKSDGVGRDERIGPKGWAKLWTLGG